MNLAGMKTIFDVWLKNTFCGQTFDKVQFRLFDFVL